MIEVKKASNFYSTDVYVILKNRCHVASVFQTLYDEILPWRVRVGVKFYDVNCSSHRRGTRLAISDIMKNKCYDIN